MAAIFTFLPSLTECLTNRGFPCCVRLPCVHAVATTPAQRLVASFAHFTRRISLPRIGGQVGLCNVLFEACSAFTHVTACTLAKSLNDPLHQRLQPFCYLHDCSDCFRLEQHRRVGFAPTEKRRLCTAHANNGHSRKPSERQECWQNTILRSKRKRS